MTAHRCFSSRGWIFRPAFSPQRPQGAPPQVKLLRFSFLLRAPSMPEGETKTVLERGLQLTVSVRMAEDIKGELNLYWCSSKSDQHNKGSCVAEQQLYAATAAACPINADAIMRRPSGAQQGIPSSSDVVGCCQQRTSAREKRDSDARGRGYKLICLTAAVLANLFDSCSFGGDGCRCKHIVDFYF
ncbi:hypothetical protein U9M48_002913 [Paspalum notatum var. saurae]|uniref:Uncharacterized protein n=1 Tax=Paspalum notatum var. saurae TaxID=547442 RepID=A0AAQ3SDR5_PASNO